jgi:hypothetical protein
MIDILENLYAILMSGVVISAVIGALIYWYAISKDINDKDDFDKKYRGSRKTKSRW